MEQKFGYYILLGFILGTILGVAWGRTAENMLLFITFGALGGVFIGWFIAAILQYRNDENKNI